MMFEPTVELCFPYDERIDFSKCQWCANSVFADGWEQHVDLDHAIWPLIQAAAQT